MKFCTHCGAEMHDEAVICIKCGCEVDKSGTKVKSKSNDTVKTLVLVFLILGCISGACCLLIPLAWCIPMTLAIKRKMDNDEPIDVALKICTMLFVSLVAGILLFFVDSE